MLDELKATADMAAGLDRKMESLHKEMAKMKLEDEADEMLLTLGSGSNKLNLLETFIEEKLGIK